MARKKESWDLANLGEGGLLRLLTSTWHIDPKRIAVGVGDDCAVLAGDSPRHSLLFKTDIVVEGVHFTRTAKPELIGRKALARALSDLAAMGAQPLAAVLTLGVPPGESVPRLQRIYHGLTRLAGQCKVNLVGGETTRARELFLNVALLGECPDYAPLLRSGAQPGDLLFVTGRLGGTQARHHLTFTPRLAEGEWLARHRLASAMMDLSDGLAADLPRLEQASKIEARLDEKAIPRRAGCSLRQALNDGEDYELLFTASPRQVATLKKKWPFATPLRCIGVAEMERAARPGPAFAHGFDHFKKRGRDTGSRGKLGR